MTKLNLPYGDFLLFTLWRHWQDNISHVEKNYFIHDECDLASGGISVICEMIHFKPKTEANL